jgi:hypothetical protein
MCLWLGCPSQCGSRACTLGRVLPKARVGRCRAPLARSSILSSRKRLASSERPRGRQGPAPGARVQSCRQELEHASTPWLPLSAWTLWFFPLRAAERSTFGVTTIDSGGSGAVVRHKRCRFTARQRRTGNRNAEFTGSRSAPEHPSRRDSIPLLGSHSELEAVGLRRTAKAGGSQTARPGHL